MWLVGGFFRTAREAQHAAAPEIDDFQRLEPEDDEQGIIERNAELLRDGLQAVGAVDGGRKPSLDFVELELLDHLVTAPGVCGRTIRVGALRGRQLVEADVPERGEDEIIRVFIPAGECAGKLRDAVGFLELEIDAACGVELGDKALAVFAGDLHYVVVRETIAGAEEEENRAAGDLLIHLAFDDEPETRCAEDDGRARAVEAEVFRGGELEATAGDVQLNRLPAEEVAKHAGEAVALRHLQALAQRKESRVSAEHNSGTVSATRNRTARVRFRREHTRDGVNQRLAADRLCQNTHDVREAAVQIGLLRGIDHQDDRELRSRGVRGETLEDGLRIHVRQRVA